MDDILKGKEVVIFPVLCTFHADLSRKAAQIN